ncbi:hypothetical protein [Paenibacillus cremeus]|uniref:Uncharacterized protein n=1 Tax=Paenibacillus cremeus TaxID=2163881 RepID=A0A559K478_9BACL|nr:hypothetical protein [Paenibacillus cremeus]TVY06948.1 hypothetical protein FPZ49_26290 [Paenibacillus cremeus]
MSTLILGLLVGLESLLWGTHLPSSIFTGTANLYVVRVLLAYPLATVGITSFIQFEREKQRSEIIDPMTNIPNQQMVLSHLKTIIQARRQASIILLTIDN